MFLKNHQKIKFVTRVDQRRYRQNLILLKFFKYDLPPSKGYYTTFSEKLPKF